MTGLRSLLLSLAAVLPLAAQGGDELTFLAGLDEFEHIREMLPSYLKRHALQLIDKRDQLVAQFATLDDLARRKAYVREVMTRDVGGFPERTPLNPRITGVLDRGDYVIEKVIFESQPHFYVTANLYLPKTGRPPYPAVLYPLGHELGAKSHSAWQQMLGSLAKKGYVALAWDPIGQGERIQIYDHDFEDSKVRASTTEHTVQGIQCLLIGDHLARYTIWDGMRALDYLLSRPEVDAKRVACTGNSGGGTHTAYLSALDDRIQARRRAVTSVHGARCCTIGPQDARYFHLRDGLDYPDFIYAFAPNRTGSFRPSAISSPSVGPARLLRRLTASMQRLAPPTSSPCSRPTMATVTPTRDAWPDMSGSRAGSKAKKISGLSLKSNSLLLRTCNAPPPGRSWICRTPRRCSRSTKNARARSGVRRFRRTTCAIAFAR
jgi:dienelactone hydrolase